jgi:hypothetical protein
MKRVLIILALLLLVVPVYAINLDVSVEPVTNAVITELDKPAVFDLKIKNLDEDEDDFEIFSLIGMEFSPSYLENIRDNGGIYTIRIEAMLNEALKAKKGFSTFEYRLKDENDKIQKEQLMINIVDLEDALDIYVEDINLESETAFLHIKNNVNFDFKEINLKIESIFFEEETNTSLAPLDEKIIEVPLDTPKLKTMNAGSYLVSLEFEVDEIEVKKEFSIRFLEQEGIEADYPPIEGLLLRKQAISKRNTGNTKERVSLTTTKDVFSGLFTSVSIHTTNTYYEGLTKHYIWEKELNPGEELQVEITTNWIYLLLIVILAGFLVFLIKKQFETDLVLRKNVSFIRTKGRELALKVTLKLKARKYLERIRVIDKLPALVKLYERFGAIPPDSIDIKNKRLDWNIESLNKDEERIFSYIIYSRVGIVGRFELPSARATYEQEGKVKDVTSNRSFYINEPRD